MKGAVVGSISGGRTSGLMLRLLVDNHAGPLRFVFANTGMERAETLDFVHELDSRWCRPRGAEIVWIEAVINAPGVGTTYRVVTYETAARIPTYGPQPVGRPAEWSHPFEAMNARFGIPNKPYPHCSRELKEVPLHKWAADAMEGQGFEWAIGMRADEAGRLGDHYYPLAEWGVTKGRVRAFWAEQAFDLGLKDYEGNCDLCWKKSLDKLLTILEEKPVVATWWAGQEAQHGGFAPERTPRRKKVQNGLLFDLPQAQPKPAAYTFHRHGMSTADLVALAKRGHFKRAVDGADAGADQRQLIDCHCGVEL